MRAQPKLTDYEAMNVIQKLLDKREWSADTFDDVAEIIRLTNRDVRDIND